MRSLPLLLLVAACGGGGGGGGTLPEIEQLASFGTVRADAPTQRDVVIENPLGADATAEDAGGAGGPFAAAAGSLPASVLDGGNISLRVVFTPPGSGVQAGVLRVRFVAGNREQDVLLRLAAQVETPSITLLTPTLAFPPLLVGEQTTLNVRVRNPSVLTPVSITAVTPLPGEFRTSFQPRMIFAQDTATFGVTFEPEAEGAFDFDIDIANDVGPALRVRVTAQAEERVLEVVTDFGSVPVTNGETAWLDVEVPPDAISVSIESVAAAPSSIVGLLGFEGPGGKVYENDTATGEFLWTPGFEGVFAATLPQNDSTTLQLVPGGGTYRFRLYLWSGSTTALDVRALVESRVGGEPGESRIDLNVFLAPGLAIANPATDTKLQAVLTRTDDIFGEIGLRVGSVDYYQLGSSAYNNVNDTEFLQMLAESAVATETRMNVFFVQTALGGGTLGVAAALPGPKRNSTAVSGVMVDFDWSDAAAVGQVTAHEIGHYLGLYHTAESDGSHDFIDDTLECPGECTTSNGGYLMHWQYFGTAMPTISEAQAHVLLVHPLVDPQPALAGLSALAQKRAPAEALVELPPGFCATCAQRHK